MAPLLLRAFFSSNFRNFYNMKAMSWNHWSRCAYLATAVHPSTKENQTRFNAIHIQMLSASLHQQIFGSESPHDTHEGNVDKVIEHLRAHSLWEAETNILPDVNFKIPKLLGNDIGEHFRIIGSRFSKKYKEFLLKLSECKLPPMPQQWKLSPGWTQYDSNGNALSIEFPKDSALVFDVEVCVQEGHFPTLASAVSENYWYLWCSERLVNDHFSWSQSISLADLIPMETVKGKVKPASGEEWKERIVIGHNVAFDRTFIKEQYLLERTKMNFVDTMSLHVCVSGLTGMQRALSVASKKNSAQNGLPMYPDMPFGWSDISSLNNLADVYSLYCDGSVLEKTDRDIFVLGTISDIKTKFQELASYCARDVEATHKILKVLTPLFFQRFQHPVTFAGLLEMSCAYLPLNNSWERYLRDAQDTYDDLQKELKLSLMDMANDSCSLLHNGMFRRDPWLWDLDWSLQSIKFRKLQSPSKKKNVVQGREEDKDNVINNICPEEHEIEHLNEDYGETKCTEEKLDESVKNIFHSAATLRKVRPFLPGYPSWYRELCDRIDNSEEDDWEPGPNLISTQMRCVPKLMHLTWDGFPLHFDAKHGWGYLVPDKQQDDYPEQSFPLWSLFKVCSNHDCKSENHTHSNIDFLWPLIKEPDENKLHMKKLWELMFSKNDFQRKDSKTTYYGVGPYDIGIGGCLFYRLPHKDGPHKRVGNPLSKDFLGKVEDGTLRSWTKGQADRALVLSKMLSYWKNAHSRIISQMVVQLSPDELPDIVTKSVKYDISNAFGAILPRLIPAGTVTRRAVEPTWLTASNAYVDRVGSELKSIIQSPPGYHFVGADVDSQELWIAAILGDSQFARMHGCTAFGWMTLQGKKATGTDMHSKTAKSVGITRDQAKTLNYARIYGAGKAFAQRLLMQFNHRLTPEEAKQKVKKMYCETKGTKKYGTSHEGYGNKVIMESIGGDSFLQRKFWVGGSESHMFNKLEEIALSSKPQTPVLGCRISRALEPDAVDNNFMTSRVNWVVQSSAVDFLHLMLVCMKWLFEDYQINGRFSICIHDEVRYLVNSEDRYRAALALHITNLLTRSFFTFKLGIKDLPQSVAFFSSVDIDSVLRKEVTMDSTTPSNPHGLEKGYGIPKGESLDVFQVMERTNGSLNCDKPDSRIKGKHSDL